MIIFPHVQETFRIIINMKTDVLLNAFVETMIFFQDSLLNSQFKEHHLIEIVHFN